MKVAALAGGLAVVAATASGLAEVSPRAAVTFSEEERGAILAHGPWPPPISIDASNRASGRPDAIALGRRLFSDTRLSLDGTRACTTCHDPARRFADGRDRSIGLAKTDRNAIALANLRLNRWFGWAGAADSLWAQSLRPVIDPKELGASAELVQRRLATDTSMAAAYAGIFGTEFALEPADRALVNIAKALAAFQETITTGRTAFDEFRDALERGDREGMDRYPLEAQRGLKIFVGKGRCTACHFGPNFSNGEFDDVGVPFFIGPGRVDQGRHAGIAAVRTSPFNLLGAFNDDPAGPASAQTRHVEQQHRNWGEFRVPSLRNVANTGPYMHNGSLATLEDVVRHYSEVDIERLHGDDGARLIQPLHLSAREAADLARFLKTLSDDPHAGK
ncbi:MAG: cytochrome-c peroxidase [Hyphomicrobiaceae bacterium]